MAAGTVNWEDMHTFLAIARRRTLSGAARDLGVNQSTMSRRLAALEARSGARLLMRTPGGYQLTGLGQAVLANAASMEEHATAFERVVQGKDVTLSGTVRLTTVETLANRLVPLAATALRRDYPGITLDVLPDTRSLSLLDREADIAIRMVRFEHAELISRRMGTLGSALYASRGYRETHPDALDCEGHSLITVLDDQEHLPEPQWLAAKVPQGTVALRANSRDAQASAAAAGLGIACLPQYLGEQVPGLERLTEAGLGPAREVWLGVHRDMRDMPRVRAVIGALDEAFRIERPHFLVG